MHTLLLGMWNRASKSFTFLWTFAEILRKVARNPSNQTCKGGSLLHQFSRLPHSRFFDEIYNIKRHIKWGQSPHLHLRSQTENPLKTWWRSTCVCGSNLHSFRWRFSIEGTIELREQTNQDGEQIENRETNSEHLQKKKATTESLGPSKEDSKSVTGHKRNPRLLSTCGSQDIRPEAGYCCISSWVFSKNILASLVSLCTLESRERSLRLAGKFAIHCVFAFGWQKLRSERNRSVRLFSR